jgi:arylsulfatase
MPTTLVRSLLTAIMVVIPALGLAQSKPNIVVIMADDVAPFDISAYHRGLGAVRTPNVDRIASEGMMVSDYYAQPSCTAGRAAFLTGQYPIRTGLTSVGQPGSPCSSKPRRPRQNNCNCCSAKSSPATCVC